MQDMRHQGRPIFSTAPHPHTAREAGDKEAPEELRCSSMTLVKEVPAGSMKSLITPKMPTDHAKRDSWSAYQGVLKAGLRNTSGLGHGCRLAPWTGRPVSEGCVPRPTLFTVSLMKYSSMVI